MLHVQRTSEQYLPFRVEVSFAFVKKGTIHLWCMFQKSRNKQNLVTTSLL